MIAEGSAVEVRSLPGYAEMTRDPHRAEVPTALIDATVAWLAQVARGPAVSIEAGETSARFGSVIERAVIREGLFGVLSTPAEPKESGVLLLNAGAIHHIGPNRLHTTLARRWAAEDSTRFLTFNEHFGMRPLPTDQAKA